jgi:type II secretory pathway component PulF
MPVFNVEALDQQGKRIKTQIEAATPNDAIMKVKVRGYKPMSVREADEAAAHPPGEAKPKPITKSIPQGSAPPRPSTKTIPPGEAPKKTTGTHTAAQAGAAVEAPTAAKAKKGFALGGRVRHKQLTQFTHQFSVLLEAGLPIVRSLKILHNQLKPCLLKNMVQEVSEDVEGGSSLSEALSKHPKAFDKLFVNMVRAGEAGGVLEEVLKRLAEFMEKLEELKRKIIGASIYPIVVIG